ncbi:hypothetical protein SOV92_07415 [Pectobacterium brasiliense]|uniref:Uncharacterized protein n=1 Tax=Pectobacterium brasiliense TaxID=180957 RepID=A0AAW9H2L2_9GAMM|nr:hypothetical protein [Pectobacterium brasiliense]MDY4377660.1 hypothetical protein [Pectobacterium brasiliense]
MSIRYAFQHGDLPELTLTGNELAQAGFAAEALSLSVSIVVTLYEKETEGDGMTNETCLP